MSFDMAPTDPADGTEDPAAPRQLTDPRTLRAVAHPTRIDLMELLGREVELTATRAGELLGLSAANCSFHLRQLAKYGFVEEVPAARGRNRPWRLCSTRHSWSDTAGAGSPEAVLTRIVWEREAARLGEWLERRHREPEEWQEAAFGTTSLVYLTPEELREMDREVTELLMAYHQRALSRAARPAGSRPVSLVAVGYPLQPTPSGG